jgi:hypothetical protein
LPGLHPNVTKVLPSAYYSTEMLKIVKGKSKLKIIKHEIAIKKLYTQRHDNLSDSPAKAGWQLKNNY